VDALYWGYRSPWAESTGTCVRRLRKASWQGWVFAQLVDGDREQLTRLIEDKGWQAAQSAVAANAAFSESGDTDESQAFTRDLIAFFLGEGQRAGALSSGGKPGQGTPMV
jgi:hypothetical protein